MKKIFLLALFISITGLLNAQVTENWKIVKSLIQDETKADSIRLKQYENHYETFLNEVRRKVADYSSNRKKHTYLFNTFQQAFCKKYVGEAILPDIFSKQEYNCATAALLYAAIAKDVNTDIDIYETTDHIFLAYPDDDSYKVIELVDPDEGMNRSENIEDEVDFLIRKKMVTNEEVLAKGKFKVYIEKIRSAKKCTFQRLTGLELQNYANLSHDNKKYRECFLAMEKVVEKARDSLAILHFGAVGVDFAEENPKDSILLTDIFSKVYACNDTSEEYETALLNVFEEIGQSLVKLGKYNTVERMMQQVQSRLKHKKIEDDSYMVVYTALINAKCDEAKFKGDFITFFALNRQYFLFVPKTLNTKSSYCDRTAYSIYQEILKHDFETALMIIDTLDRDMPDENCLPPFKSQLRQSFATEGYVNLTDEQLVEKIASLKTKMGNNPTDSMSVFLCMSAYRNRSMLAVRQNDWKKAIECSTEAMKLFSSDKGVQDDAKMINEQYAIVKKYSLNGGKTRRVVTTTKKRK